MKLSEGFFITRKEVPNDEASVCGQLLVKSGMIYKISNGVYSYLPLGFKVLENVKKVIIEEHNKNNCNELLMPTLVEENIFERTNRIELFDKELFRIIDRESNHICLCPTSEELFAVIASIKIKSYKDLHFTLYQIGNKYRDEIKSKNSLIRKKEFIMCDAYSFDSNDSGLSISYDTMYHTYSNIFKRLGIDYLVAESNPGFMQGKYSEEFHAICDSGEDEIVKCTNCTYTANRLNAEVLSTKPHNNLVDKKNTKVYTPNVKTIDEVSNYLHINIDNIIKSLIYKVDSKYVMVLMRGNDEVNELKLSQILKTDNICLASQEEIESIGGCIGYVGPIKTTMKVVADFNIKFLINGVCGSNIQNYHYINVTPSKDFKVDKYADIKIFSLTDKCPICKSNVNIYKTMEIANIFKLGTIYSDAFSLKYSDEQNEYNRVYMGSYGIGLDRCISAIVEKNHDENGIIWPIDIAPYKVAIVVVNILDRDALRYAKELYNKLIDMGIDTILDDRRESAGVKFKDIDLIGIPIRITVGYKISENIVEYKLRTGKETIDINKTEVINKIKDILYSE